MLLSRATLWPHGDAAWVLALLAGGVILWTQRRRRGTAGETVVTTADGDSRRAGPRRARDRAVSIVLAILVVPSSSRRRPWRPCSTSTCATASATAPTRSRERPCPPEYKLGIGELRIDLRGARFPVGETRVDARVGIGALKVVVPADVALRVEATSQVGDVHVLGLADDGRNAAVQLDGDGRRVLVLDANVGLGTIHVVRATPLTP